MIWMTFQAWDWQHLLVERCLASSSSPPLPVIASSEAAGDFGHRNEPRAGIRGGGGIPSEAPSPEGGNGSTGGRSDSSSGSRGRGDSLLILQHPPVYTLGAGSTHDNVLFDPATSTVPLFRTERGGEVTFHGPGQV